MSHLAIKKYNKNPNEVINILEMIGGIQNNNEKLNGNEYKYFYIQQDNKIIGTNKLEKNKYIIYDVNSFKQNFPFKIGDWVYATTEIEQEYCEITNCNWSIENNTMTYQLLSHCYNEYYYNTVENLLKYNTIIPQTHHQKLNACINCENENICTLPFPINLSECCEKYKKK